MERSHITARHLLHSTFHIPIMNFNKAMILGNLTRDPESKTTPSGQTVTTFGIATNRFYFDQQKQRQQKVEFHNIVA